MIPLPLRLAIAGLAVIAAQVLVVTWLVETPTAVPVIVGVSGR